MLFRSAFLLVVSSASTQFPVEEGTEQTGLLQKRSRRQFQVGVVTQGKAIQADFMPKLTKLFESTSKLVRSGATNETLSFVKDTLQEIEKQVLPAIKRGHNVDVKELGELFAAFSPIEGKYGEDTSTLKDLRGTEQDLSSKHTACRDSEHTACSDFTTCTTEMQKLKAIYKIKEEGFNMIHKTFQGGSKEEGFKIVKVYTKEGEEYFLAQDMYNNQTKKCTDKKTNLNRFTDNCNVLKKQLEKSSCASQGKHAHSLELFSASWKSQTGALESAKKAVAELEKDRKIEFRSIKSVECLLNRITASGGMPCGSNEADEKIAACRVVDVVTTWLDISYPEVPDEPVKADPAPYPCNEDFKLQEYGKLKDRKGENGRLQCGISTGVAESKWTEILLLPTCEVCYLDLATPAPFVATPPPVHYMEFQDQACAGRNELGTFNGDTISSCKSKCNKDPSCVSLEYYPSTVCHLSTSCTEAYMRTSEAARKPVLYIKKLEASLTRPVVR